MRIIAIEALAENAPDPGLKNYFIVPGPVRHDYQSGKGDTNGVASPASAATRATKRLGEVGSCVS